MKIVLLVLALLLVTATALPLLNCDQWWIRALAFPRLQLAIAGSVLLVLYLYFCRPYHGYDLVVAGLLLLALGYQVVNIFPYTVLMAKQVQSVEPHSDQPSLSLLIANVMMDNRESQAFLDMVHAYDPDIILTMETDAWWEQALRPLEKAYPHTLKSPLDNSFGMLVHSRLALRDTEIRFILKEGIPSMHMQVMLSPTSPVFLHFVHPEPPNPKYATETTQRDAELLIVGREADRRDRATIIAGDFNDVPWSVTTRLFQKASGLLDPRVGRGIYSTFDARYPLLRWPLDHVFLSAHFKLIEMERGPAWGSDHFPLFIALSLASVAETNQEEAETSPAEQQQVDEKIDEGQQQTGQ